jgi:uncharacterized protein (TIGR02271 family)
MSRTVTALFDTRQEAEAAKARLQSSNLDAERVRIIDKNSSSSSASSSSSSSGETGENRGFFASLSDMFMPNEDRYAYAEGIDRGGFLVCAQVDDDEAEQAIRILDESNSVDFDARQEEWRGEGWAGWTGGTMNNQQPAPQSSAPQQSASLQGSQNQQFQQPQQQQGMAETGRTVSEERIPLVEEELRVGKREVERGGARVRSYVRETPVHEQVTLREEHVSVERRPVDQELGRGELDRNSDLLKDRTIEMTETAEEAVVAKEARVREEIVVRKTAEEHAEQIDDTVRRTEVEVDEGMNRQSTTGQSGSAFGFGGDGGQDGSRTDSERADFERTNNPGFRP